MRTDRAVRRTPAAALSAVLWVAGGGCGPGPPPAAPVPAVTSERPLTGFDPAGEPVLQTLAGGGLRVRFASLPPSYATGDRGLEAYAEIDRRLAEAIGAEVEWDPPDDLRIPDPRPDTADRVAAFLRDYRPLGGLTAD